ncbi:SDR family oxidoreductase [Ramlibacter terrae]|uniref:SDR family oxidoreductase n=1 Tax=Ramlibacter terrae TaxID=2732511 RepID=A0ABX6P1C0_9BURK|nr:SDR family oxidoreductase [Ramlibacter terrae]
MDLGIRGRRAIVCGASRGSGRGCAEALAVEGVELFIAARGVDALEALSVELWTRYGARSHIVPCDVTTQEGRAAVLAACPAPDILVNNAAGPPGGDFRQFGPKDWIAAMENNLVAPLELIKATIDGMVERKFGRIVNITSRSVKAPLPHLPLSNGARAGLTAVVATIARDPKVARANVTVNNLLPGLFDTELYHKRNAALVRQMGKPIEDVDRDRLAEIPAGRPGDPKEFGVACAFLCGAHSGYITGQNLLLDGGATGGAVGARAAATIRVFQEETACR